MYKSPIYLVSDRVLDSATPATLKMWRKEVMLRFKLSNDPAITVNGKEYDKQAVTDTFAELEKDFDFHLKLFKNKSLLAFLEAGDLGFFQDGLAQGVFQDAVFQDKVYHLFSQAYGRVFTDAIGNPTNDNINRLAIINNSPLAITSEASSEVFADAFGKFRHFISDFEQLSRQCLNPNNTYQVKPEIAQYVNPQIQKLLRQLPAVFQDLKVDFARLIHNNLLVQTLGNGRAQNLSGFYNPATLKTLLTAAVIDRDILNLPQVNQIIDLLQQAISGSQARSYGQGSTYERDNIKKRTQTASPPPPSSSSSSMSAGSMIWMIVLGLIFLFRIGTMAERCGRSNTSSNYSYRNNQNQQERQRRQQREFEKLMREVQANQEKQKRRDAANRSKSAESWEQEIRDEVSKGSKKRTSTFKDAVVEEKAPPPPPPPAKKIIKREFKQSDLFGSWVTFRLTEEGDKINYKYNIINPTRGERVLRFSNNEKGIKYSVKQPFIYKLTVDKWNTGRIYMTMQGAKPQGCTQVEADTLIRVAEREIGVPLGRFDKTTTFDYVIPKNKSVGLQLGKENYRPSSDIEDIGLFAYDDRKNQFMVGYVNNLLERNGVSIGRNPMGMRWYADKEAKYWMAKRSKKAYQVAEIVMRSKKMYFKPVHFTPEDSEVLPMFWVRNVYFIDARGRKQQGDLRVTYHRKGDYFSIKTEVI